VRYDRSIGLSVGPVDYLMLFVRSLAIVAVCLVFAIIVFLIGLILAYVVQIVLQVQIVHFYVWAVVAELLGVAGGWWLYLKWWPGRSSRHQAAG
jgi:hypothetical protein